MGKASCCHTVDKYGYVKCRGETKEALQMAFYVISCGLLFGILQF